MKKDIEMLALISEMIKDFNATVWELVKGCEVVDDEDEDAYIAANGPQIFEDSETKVLDALWDFNSRWDFKFKASNAQLIWEIRNHFSNNTFDIYLNTYNDSVSYDKMWSTVDR